jgi:3-deoxy-D-manno-octulosonic-acid transferase
MRIIYSLFICIYALAIHLASLFSKQAKSWIDGRKGLLTKMEQDKKYLDKLVWFHCASLGEFEQGRPVIEQFRDEFPEFRILLTFFSPSGYEVRKEYPVADHIYYLPLDTPGQVKRFLTIWNPVLAVFIKYEYWFNYLHELHKRQIPSIVISATFRPGQHFFKAYGFWFRKHLRCISHFFVQNEASQELLKKIGVGHCTISGDTRFDRVAEISRFPRDIPAIRSFATNSKVLVAGSTWEKDETLIAEALKHSDLPLKLIIAPHQISDQGLARLQSMFALKSIRFSEVKGIIQTDVKVIIIDSVGLLSQIYRYGHMAYIGGGFGKGIHNILEAATFGMPVFFGPNYKKFVEANELCDRGGAFSVKTTNELRDKLKDMLYNEKAAGIASDICKNYVNDRTGATSIIINYMTSLLA